MEGLRADVARLALRVVRARLDRDRDGLRVLLICVVSLGATSPFYWFAERVVAAFFPMRIRPTVARACPHFFPNDKPSSAQSALREASFVWSNSSGQPYDAWLELRLVCVDSARYRVPCTL